MYSDPRSPKPWYRRSWPIIVVVLVVFGMIAGWTGFWFYAAAKADDVIASSLEREADEGRLYRCGTQTRGGFPFRMELRCTQATALLQNLSPPLWLELKHVLVAAQIYQPTLLIGEFTGPLELGERDQPARYFANWAQARTSLRGQPRAPERVSIVTRHLTLEHTVAAGRQPMMASEELDLHARLAGGTVKDHPVLDVAGRFQALTMPGLHAALAQPVNGEFDTTLRGLKDFAPKSWAARFREVQQSDGRIEIRSARLSQADWLAVGTGDLSLTSTGHLSGEVKLTVAGLDKLLQVMGVEYLARSGGNGDKINSALNALDKLVPGLGTIAREKAGAGLAAGAAMLGQETQLEGRKAVALPLRFENGSVYLGSLLVAKTQPLF